MQKKYDYIFKIILIGSTSVGKTSILRRYADNQYNQTYLSTIGIDFRFKSFYINQKFIKLQIWDTAGQQRFKNITKSYYKGSHAIIIVYDAQDQKSFSDIQSWLESAVLNSDTPQIYIFANKCDTKSKSYIKSIHQRFCDNNGIKLFPVSAKTGNNINQVFQMITQELIKIHPPIQQHIKLQIKQKFQQKQKNCNC